MRGKCGKKGEILKEMVMEKKEYKEEEIEK